MFRGDDRRLSPHLPLTVQCQISQWTLHGLYPYTKPNRPLVPSSSPYKEFLEQQRPTLRHILTSHKRRQFYSHALPQILLHSTQVLQKPPDLSFCSLPLHFGPCTSPN